MLTMPAFQPPSVDRLLHSPAAKALLTQHGRSACTDAIRDVVAELRECWRGNKPLPAWAGNDEGILAHTATRLADRSAARLVPVFNLTGTVLHTNLGRALLPQEAVDATVQALTSPVNLEYDLASGGRGDRDDLVNDLLCELTGAEAATIVNNNAAAVLLALATLAPGKEVIVSRGELVEIGGAFRIPDVMAHAGAHLMEVGTTNRTHARDYENAIGDATALLMKVHCSNYAITGFTKSVTDAETAQIAHAHGLPMMVDLGSGTLADLSQWGLPHETTVQETLAAGADLVSFSGDKLLGGPQAGMIVGRKDLIARIKRHPLKRALRAGKITLAALEATLRLYQHPETLAQRLTTLRLFTRPYTDMHTQALQLQPVLQQVLGEAYRVETADMQSQIGSGALPVEMLPSHGLKITPTDPKREGQLLQQLEARLRQLPRPVIGRIQSSALWLDLRCLEAADQAAFENQVNMLASA